MRTKLLPNAAQASSQCEILAGEHKEARVVIIRHKNIIAGIKGEVIQAASAGFRVKVPNKGAIQCEQGHPNVPEFRYKQVLAIWREAAGV